MSRVYLYGFTPAGSPLPQDGLLGVGGGEVELIPLEDLAAVVSPAPLEEFEDARITERSADLEWMAELGLRHEQVVAWFVDHATILPSRLLTLFSGPDALRAAAARDAEAIRARLRRFEGVREWDLKVGYRKEEIESHLARLSEPIAALDRELEEAGPGRRYLLGRKRADLARSEGRAAAARVAAELLGELEPLARESRRSPPPADDLPVLLNVAFLVERSTEAELAARGRRAAERLARLGMSVELTGPWAPYRFLDPPDG